MAQVKINIRNRHFGICTLQYDRTGMSRLTENGSSNTFVRGAPDTVRLPVETGRSNTIILHEGLQRWMHKLCWERTPSMPEEDAKKSWRSLMSGTGETGATARAFTNYGGSNTNRDYINDANPDADPIRMDFVLCGGAFVRILRDDRRRKIKTEDCWVIEAIDPYGDFTRFHPKTHPWLFFFPTISVRIPYRDRNGTPTGKFIEYVSEPFPQYNDLSVMPILAQPGETCVYIPKHRITPCLNPKTPFRRTTASDQYHNYTTRAYPYPYPY